MNQRGGRSCEERNLMEVDPDMGKRWVKLAKKSKNGGTFEFGGI
jgi:hypothetical protein